MSQGPSDDRTRPTAASTASRALVSAALGGLLCVALHACTLNDDVGGEKNSLLDGSIIDSGKDSASADAAHDSGASDAADASDAVATDASEDATTEDSGDAGDDAVADASDASDDADDAGDAADANAAPPTCPNMPEAGVVTSSTVVALTLEEFTAQCDTLGGTLEIHPHCGGSNSCKGMSYDVGTQTLTEHSCMGLNTCAGYSCIICD